MLAAERKSAGVDARSAGDELTGLDEDLHDCGWVVGGDKISEVLMMEMRSLALFSQGRRGASMKDVGDEGWFVVRWRGEEEKSATEVSRWKV
jgi:hypothetical protein